MALKDSNILALLNSYNVGKVAESSMRQAQASAEIAAGNRLIASQLEQSLHLQQHQADIQRTMLESAAQQNRQLSALQKELSEVGFAIEGLGSDIRAQTNIHREHYDEIKKEKKLKEVLYNFEKYLDNCESLKDKISAAYGSKKTGELIESSGFTTADLSDKSDKRDYDTLMQRATDFWSGLTPEAKGELDAMEKMYFSYRSLSSMDIEELLDRNYALKALAKGKNLSLPQKPQKKEIKMDKILKKYPPNESLMTTVDKHMKKRKKYGFLCVFGSCLAFVVLLAAWVMDKDRPNQYTPKAETVIAYDNWDMKKKSGVIKKGEVAYARDKGYGKLDVMTGHVSGWVFENQMQLWHPEPSVSTRVTTAIAIILFGAAGLLFVFFIFLQYYSPLKGVTSTDFEKLSFELKKYMAESKVAEKEYSEQRARYDAECDRLDGLQKTEMEALKRQNSQIDSENEKIEQIRADIRNKHEKTLADLKSRVNAFLELRPNIQEFLPRLS